MLSRAAALGCALLVAYAGVLCLGVPAHAEPEGAILQAGNPNAVPGRYIVVLNESAASTAAAVSTRARDLAGRFGGQTRHVYAEGVRGFSITMPDKQARRLAADPTVAYVEQVQRMSLLSLGRALIATA